MQYFEPSETHLKTNFRSGLDSKEDSHLLSQPEI